MIQALLTKCKFRNDVLHIGPTLSVFSRAMNLARPYSSTSSAARFHLPTLDRDL